MPAMPAAKVPKNLRSFMAGVNMLATSTKWLFLNLHSNSLPEVK